MAMPIAYPEPEYEAVELAQWLDRLSEALRETLEVDAREFIEVQASRYDVRLTAGAYMMLLIPLWEASGHLELDDRDITANRLDVDPVQLRDSLRDLVQSMGTAPAPAEQRLSGEGRDRIGFRSSFSAIRAFVDRFCQIPPFCR